MKNHFGHIDAVNFLNNQYWHDSILYEFQIIKRNSADQARVILNLIVSEDGSEEKLCHLTFYDCYLIKTIMNGGVIALSDGEMIDTANASINNPLIDNVVESWKKVLDLDGLFHFSFTLSSTNSKIDIVCKSVTQEFISN